MGCIFSKIFSKGQTRNLLKEEDLLKSIIKYCSKQGQSRESLILELIAELDDRLSNFEDEKESERKNPDGSKSLDSYEE